MFLALATPTSGVAWSSYGASWTSNPISFKGPLSCSRASSAPCLIPTPSWDWPPESGLCVAILIMGFAPPPAAPQAASTMLASTSTVSKAYERLDILPPPKNLVILRLSRRTAGLTLQVDKTIRCRHHLLWLKLFDV